MKIVIVVNVLENPKERITCKYICNSHFFDPNSEVKLMYTKMKHVLSRII